MKPVIALVFVASLCRTLALPDGAPAQACINLTPQHGETPRPNPSSSIIDITNFASEDNGVSYMYIPGATYMLTLVSTGTFRGFLVNAQTLDGDVVGEFVLPENVIDVQLSNCDPSEQAVTHTNNDDKTYVEFYWTAPSSDVGGIQFHYTTVRVFEIYWVDETTDTIFGPEGPAQPLPDPTPTQTPEVEPTQTPEVEPTQTPEPTEMVEPTDSATGVFVSLVCLLLTVTATLLL